MFSSVYIQSLYTGFGGSLGYLGGLGLQRDSMLFEGQLRGG